VASVPVVTIFIPYINPMKMDHDKAQAMLTMMPIQHWQRLFGQFFWTGVMLLLAIFTGTGAKVSADDELSDEIVAVDVKGNTSDKVMSQIKGNDPNLTSLKVGFLLF
jgi:hypothetical protein